VHLWDERSECGSQERIGALERPDEWKEQLLAERLLRKQREYGAAPLVQRCIGGGALRRKQLEQLENRLRVELAALENEGLDLRRGGPFAGFELRGDGGAHRC